MLQQSEPGDILRSVFTQHTEHGFAKRIHSVWTYAGSLDLRRICDNNNYNLLVLEASVASYLAILGPLSLMTVTILLFLGFLFGIYRFLRWLWARLPTIIVSVDPNQLDKTLGLLLALVFFPRLVSFAWDTAQALVNYIPEIIKAISAFEIPRSCTRSLETESAACVSDFSANLARFVGFASNGLVGTLHLKDFPAADFVWFLLTAVITTQVIGAFYQAATITRIRWWYDAARAVVPVVPVTVWQRLAFTILVLVSFYLGLCALLAIPLFQDKSRSQQLTVEALGKALDVNIIKPEQFDQIFPDPPALREPTPPKTTETNANEVMTIFFNSEIQKQKETWQDLKKAWSALRATAKDGPAAWRDQAMTTFANGLEAGVGKKPTAKHYNDLFLWHQEQSQLTREALSQCQTAITSFVFTASQISDGLRMATEGATSAAVYDPVVYQALQLQKGVSGVCKPIRYEATPQRPSIAVSLGPIGSWTHWLLDTEQMPVVIIVGLVGFSLLGATVSRAVRATGEKLTASLTLDDLLVVIAGGMTAAVVVFLAAYGGLAVLGNAGGDPNPYVVFVTCLIGAVYSEDVWSWARKRLLASQTADKDHGQHDQGRNQVHTGTKSQDQKKSKGA